MSGTDASARRKFHPQRKNFIRNRCRVRESLDGDSLVFDRFSVLRAPRKAFRAKNFCPCAQVDCERSTAKKVFTRAYIDRRQRASTKLRTCKKLLNYRMICDVGARRAKQTRLHLHARNRVASQRRDASIARATRVARTQIVKWSRCFSYCAVVLEVQCTSIPDVTDMRHPP